MDTNDRHYYCCGDCQALFPTLRDLGKHKVTCEGSTDIGGNDSLYAYTGALLERLAKCSATCFHSETCQMRQYVPAVSGKPSSQRSKNSGRRVIRKNRSLLDTTKRHLDDGNKVTSVLFKRRKTKHIAKLSEPSMPDGERLVDQQSAGSVEQQNLVEDVIPSEEVEDKSAQEETSHTSPLFSCENQRVSPHGQTYESEDTSHDALNSQIEIPSLDSGTQVDSDMMSDANATVAEKPVLDIERKMVSLLSKNAQNTSQINYPVSSEQIDVPAMSSSDGRVTLHQDKGESLHKELGIIFKTSHENFSEDGSKELEISETDSMHCEENFVQKCQNSNKPCSDQSRPLQGDRTATKTNLHEEMKKFRKQLPMKGKSGMAYFYVCNVCGWKSPHLGFFMRHQKCHNGLAPDSTWKCDLCDFRCKNSTELKRHCDKHSKPFMCEVCSWRFTRKKDLSRHLYIHSGDFPYKCPHCEYRCRQAKSLSEHMRKHTGDLICCPVEGCTFRSAYKWAVKSHHLSKHVPTKRFQCPDCAYKTSDSNSMLRHKRLHAGEKNFKCSVCNYRAVAKHEISRHMRCHTKEKVYFCDRCDYSTSHSSGLRIHMMNHLGVKPWQCVMCGYNSLTRSKVLRHVRQTHKGQGPEDANDAVVNLGLKLDINVKEYKSPHESSECTVVYDIQKTVQDYDMNNVQLIVHELPGDGESCIKVVTADHGELSEGTTLDLNKLQGLHFKQLNDGIEVQHVAVDQTVDNSGLLQVASAEGECQVEIKPETETQTCQVVEIDSHQGSEIAHQEGLINVCQTVEIGNDQVKMERDKCLVEGLQWTAYHVVVDTNQVQQS